MNERDKYIAELVAAEQAQRTYADDCREVARYMEGRDRKVDIVPYVAPESETRDTGEFTPTQVRTIKALGIGGTMVTFWVSFFQVVATGALNSVFQWGAGGLFLLILFSGFKGAATPGATTETGGGKRGGTSGGGNQYNQWNQYNNFGNNPNQKNG